MTNKELEIASRVTDQIKTNMQLFLDVLWKQSEKGRKSVIINVSELDKIDHDYFCDHYLVAVKSKEAVQ